MENQEYHQLYLFAQAAFAEHRDLVQVELELYRKSDNKVLITEVLNQLKKERNAAKNKNGLLKVVLGILFLVLSFIVTYINFHTDQPFALIMYSFTTLGLGILLWGLYDLFN
jgi:predicted phage tail protein